MAKEMKGRPTQQTYLVADSCRIRFPALPSYTKVKHLGALRCFSDRPSLSFQMRIDAEKVQVGQCTYPVTFRDPELLRATSRAVCLVPKWSSGTDIVINFRHGGGSFSNANNHLEEIDFTCRES